MKQDPRRHQVFKIILVGAQSVGKTSIITRFIQGTFQDQYFTTIGIDFKLHNLTVGNQQIKLQIWDTAGQQRFQSLASSHFKGAHGCICVLDITKKQSLDSAKFYLEKSIKQYGIDNKSVYLVANKIDIQQKRILSQQSIRELAEQYEVDLINISAKEGTGINKLFEDLSHRMIQQRGESQPSQISDNKNPKIQLVNGSGGCKC